MGDTAGAAAVLRPSISRSAISRWVEAREDEASEVVAGGGGGSALIERTVAVAARPVLSLLVDADRQAVDDLVEVHLVDDKFGGRHILSTNQL